jgi:arabinofuranan 3-O-arabinosyltransferase
MWLALVAGLLALPFLSLPGRYVFDTRDPLWFNPGAYLSRALVLWRSSPYLGHEQHDGIVVPMGIVVWLLRSAGLSMWVAERLWHGLLLFTATAGTILLMDGLRGRKSILAPATAGLAYSLTAYSFGYGLFVSAVFLPYVLLPLLLLITLKGLSDRRMFWPALFGLTTLLMGGGNGAPQGFVLLTTVALIAWAVAVERTVALRTALAFAGWSLLFVIGMNAYWLFLLRSSEVTNALTFSEQPSVINVSSSASEAIRGLGFWQFYGGDQFGPWVPAVRAYLTSVPLILAGVAIPVGAIVSAWLVRWRYRLFFLLLAVISVFVAGGLFPVSSPTPFGRFLTWMYDHVPGAAGLRTTYKVTAQINLGFALLVGFGLAALWRASARLRRPQLARGLALALAIAVIGGNAYPLWAGKLYNPARGVGLIPFYWQRALNELDQRDDRYRVFFAPATTWTTYRWGSIKEGVIADDPTLAAITPRRLPVGQRYGSNLVAAVEQPYFDELSAAGTSQLLRYLGVSYVVLQNDIDWQRSHTARPARLQVLLRDPALVPFTSFGIPGLAVPPGSAGSDDPDLSVERILPPVQVLAVTAPSRYIRAEGADPVIVSGDGYGIAEASRQGLLRGGPPVLYSGTLTPKTLEAVLGQAHPSFVITDSNRRRVWYFTGPRSPHSYTLPAGQTIDGRDIGYRLFGDREATQSVAVYPGLRSISASHYGSLFGSEPQYRPANAFDQDPSTVWALGGGRNPLGQWIQAALDRPALLSSLTISVPAAGWTHHVTQVRIGFSDGSSVTRALLPRGATNISFSPRRTNFVRVEVEAVSRQQESGLPGVAIGDIDVPGFQAAEMVQVPTDLFDTARSSRVGLAGLAEAPLAYVFERARTGGVGQVDEEAGILRRFETPAPIALTLSGSVHLNPASPDDEIDRALLGPLPVRVTSSSRLLNNPRLRGSAALDGDPRTAWVPAEAKGAWLTVSFAKHTIDHLVVDTAAGPEHSPVLGVRATFSDGSSVEGQPDDFGTGTITMDFPPRSVSSLTLEIEKVFAAGSTRPPPVAIQEVHIPEVQPVQVRDGAPMPCYVGPGLSLDGGFVPAQASGTVGDLLSGRTVGLHTCGDQPIRLGSGAHDLIAHGAFQADVLTLATPGFGRGPVQAPPPAVDFATRRDGGFDVQVSGATGPYHLVIGQNFDEGWRASIDGADLGPPLLLDGYSAGWRIERAGSYTVTVRYGPQRTYTIAVMVTALAAAAACLIIGRELLRRRRKVRRT